MRGEHHNEPPPDIEFPYFEVAYYEQPLSVGIRVTATDARRERLEDPSQTFHGDGSINIWKHASEDTQHRWRQKLGELLRGRFLLEDLHLREHLQPMRGRLCFLISFPKNYELFTQEKDGRTDHYLVGSTYIACFRSPQEFFPHIIWLMKGSNLKPGGFRDCECKYCDGTRSQKDIDRAFRLPGRKDSGHRGSGHHSGRHGGSAAATSETIILQAKDYRNLKKPSTGAQQTASKGIESIDPSLL